MYLIKLEKTNMRLTFPRFFLEKPNLSESVLYHCELFDWTSFGLDIGNCIVHVVIFIKKYLVNLFTISFNEFLKILTMVILAMLTKICTSSMLKKRSA